MAETNEIVAALKALQAVFLRTRRRQDLEPETVRLYGKALRFIEPDALSRAVDWLIAHGEHFPSPGEIHQAVTRTAPAYTALEHQPFPDPPPRSERGVRVQTLREEIAQVYRIRMAQGRPFGPGLEREMRDQGKELQDHPDVAAALEEWREYCRGLDAERADHPGHPSRRDASRSEVEDFVTLCAEQFRRNVTQGGGAFVTMSGKAVNPLRELQVAFGITAREEPPASAAGSRKMEEDG